MEKKSLYLILLFQNVIFIMKKKLLLSTYSNISTKICYLNGGLDHRADLLLHLHLRHFGRRIPIFYRDSRENNSMEKYVIYFVIFVDTYLPTFLSHLKKLPSILTS